MKPRVRYAGINPIDCKLLKKLTATATCPFDERQMTAHNIAENTNSLASPKGLNQVARMLADGTIKLRANRKI